VDLHAEKLFELHLDNTTRGREFKIIPEDSVIDIRKYFIAQRISQVWNELPQKRESILYHYRQSQLC